MSEYLPDPISFSDDRYGRIISLLFFWNEELIIMITFSNFTFFLNSTENSFCTFHFYIVRTKLTINRNNFPLNCGGHHGPDCMVVGFITTYAISTYHHYHEFKPRSGEVYSIQHYVIMFVIDLWRSVVSSTNKTDHHNIIEILLKVA